MIHVRTASHDDAQNLIDLFKKHGRDPEQGQRYLDWQAMNQAEIVLASTPHQTLVGHAIILWESRFQVHRTQCIPECMDLFVSPAYRRQGHAKTILQFCETRTHESGRKTLGLGALAVDGNQHSHHLYLSSGYQIIGSEVWFEGNIIIYQKDLDHETTY